MVDLSACKAAMRNKKKSAKYIDPESFYIARRRAGLTMVQAAEMLDVTTRTLRNWESGTTRLPYMAMRLMRVMGGYELVGKKWDGWSFWRGALWTPEGRRFEEHELRYVSTYIALARTFLKAKAQTSTTIEASPFVRGEASAATAALGVQPHRNIGFRGCNNASQQEKRPTLVQLGNAAKIRNIDGSRKLAANDDHESEVL